VDWTLAAEGKTYIWDYYGNWTTAEDMAVNDDAVKNFESSDVLDC